MFRNTTREREKDDAAPTSRAPAIQESAPNASVNQPIHPGFDGQSQEEIPPAEAFKEP